MKKLRSFKGLNENLVNSKMNKTKAIKSVLLHIVCDICRSTGDIFEQLYLLILPSFNRFASIKIN